VIQKLLIVLAAVTVFVLYRSMRHELALPDPTRPPTEALVFATMKDMKLACDRVASFRFLTHYEDWNYYFTRCGDGGRYLFLQLQSAGRVYARSCTEEALHGFRCPDE
jgi:hypothetical protein